MSTDRISKKAGWLRRGHPRGPNGRYLCRWCGQEVPKGRITFCSEPCVHEHKIRSDPGYVRQKLFERDGGICAHCGVHADQEKPKWNELRRYLWWLARVHFQSTLAPGEAYGMWYGRASEAVEKELKVLGIPGAMSISWWQAHHVTAVVEDGGGCDLSGYITLCTSCHRKETKELRQRLKQKKQNS